MFATAQPNPHAPNGARLVSTDGRTLPLKSVEIAADACAGLCRVVLTQRFANPHAEPLRVTYKVPLPADGAVSGFAFTVAGERIVGEIDRKAAARERFEKALMEGRSGALVEQDRSSLFTQEVGNIPPGEEVLCELTIDQPLAWRDGWAWRFPTVVAPRFLGGPSRVVDAKRVTVDVAEQVDAKAALTLTIRDRLTGAPHSPSHGLNVEEGCVTLTEAALDRDVVVRWPVAAREPGLSLDTGRRPAPLRSDDDSAYGALTLVPPQVAGPEVPRDLIVLLDTSGSMGGEPLAQATRVVGALVEGLSRHDRLEMIEFSNRPRRWKKGPVEATPLQKRAALEWLAGLRASGGTQMRDGILAALEPLRPEAQRQVLLVTDGLIGFEAEIIGAIRDRMPAGCRVHTLGIGHGVNRSLTGPSARAGAGVELICAPGEDVEPVVARLLARTQSPQVVDLEVSGSAVRGVAPARLPDLFAGAPARIAVELAPGGGTLEVRGRTARGPWRSTLALGPVEAGNSAVAALFGRERVEDLETRAACGEQVDARLEALGLRFGISTRMTSWIAVSTSTRVDPTAATREETMPHLLPAGMSAEGVGLRPTLARAASTLTGGGGVRLRAAAGMAPPAPPAPTMSAPAPMGAPPPAGDGFADDDAFDEVADLEMPEPMPFDPADTGAFAVFGEGAVEPAEREEAPAPMKKKGKPEADEEKGVLGKLRRALRRPRKARRKLRATFRRVGEVWVLSIEADADFEWKVDPLVEVHFGDGGYDRFSVDRARSTAPGAATKGSTLRLAVLHGDHEGRPARVRMGGFDLEVHAA